MSENKEQNEAIYHSEDKHLAIIAGPGTGKTRVIMKRLRYLLEDMDVDQDSLLVITYTNRAINEVKKRIEHNIDKPVILKYGGTIHSICRKLLTKYKGELSNLMGIKLDNITVSDDSQALGFLYGTFKQKSWGHNANTFSAMVDFFHKTKLFNYLEGFDTNSFVHDGFSKEYFGFDRFIECFDLYQKHLRERSEFDFDDLLIWFHHLLIHNKEVKEQCIESFKHILVDEFQDMNRLQLEIIRELAGDNKNIFCVGDPNQAIYSFQGAYPDIFEHIKDLYGKDIKVLFLKQNYRNTEKVIDLAGELISHNKSEFKCEILPIKKEGAQPTLCVFKKFDQQNDWYIEKIKELQKQGTKLKDIAILFRNRSHVKNLKHYFSDKGVGIVDLTHYKAFDDLETQVYAAFMSFCFGNDEFSISLLLSYYVNSEEISSEFVYDLEDIANAKGVDAFKALSDYLPSKSEENDFYVRLMDLLNWLSLLKEKYVDDDFDENLLKAFFKDINKQIRKFDKKFSYQKPKNKIISFFNCAFKPFSFPSNIEYFCRLALQHVKGIHGLQEDNFINFSTIHTAKGTEFDYVFVVGLSQGRLPSKQSLDEELKKKKVYFASSIEEERRVFYVATTRTKTALIMSHVSNDLPNVSKELIEEKSMFIDEVSKHLVEVDCSKPKAKKNRI